MNMDVDKRPGIAFQDFVAMLERLLADDASATVYSPKRLRDRDTGRWREHDVVITWRRQHHQILTALECKDTGRKIGVPAVEAFAKKCEKTGIHHGVIVSSQGFTGSATLKAAALNITLMELKDAEAFPWMGIDFVVQDTRQFGHMDVFVECQTTCPSGEFTLIDTVGKEVSSDALHATIQANLPFDSRDDLVGTVKLLHITMNTQDWRARDSDGIEHLVDKIEVRTTLTIIRKIKPFTLHTYAGPHAGIDVATAEISAGGMSGKIVLLHGEEGTRVMLHRDS